MKPRFVFLTAGYGEGHNAAARALAAAADEQFGDGAARVVDIFALARPRLNALSRKAYLAMINRVPHLWRSAYAWLDRSPRSTAFFGILRRETALLSRIIARERPDILCSTYPAYGYMLDRLQGEGSSLPPHFTVVTDSISINSLWWRAHSAGWFVPNPDSAAVLQRAGVRGGRIHALGFPVDPVFGRAPAHLACTGISAVEPPRVLYVVNSATPTAIATARRLLAQHDWDVTVTVGRNETLRTELMRAAQERSRPTPILGWTDQIPRLLLTHHVVVSKAGGATTQEAIAARCPMVVNQIVPGQEEGNYELLRRHGIGAYAPTPDAVIDALRWAFADDGAVWRRWRAAVEQLARPRAAHAIVAQMALRVRGSASVTSGA